MDEIPNREWHSDEDIYAIVRGDVTVTKISSNNCVLHGNSPLKNPQLLYCMWADLGKS